LIFGFVRWVVFVELLAELLIILATTALTHSLIHDEVFLQTQVSSFGAGTAAGTDPQHHSRTSHDEFRATNGRIQKTSRK
jgi:hypothetical protein